MGGASHAIHAHQPIHMQTQHAYTTAVKKAVAPSSWAVGTFHQNNPIYNQRIVSLVDEPVAAHRGISSRQVS